MRGIRLAVLLTAACAGAHELRPEEIQLQAGSLGVVAEIGAEDERALETAPSVGLLLRLAQARSPDLRGLRQRAAAMATRVDVEGALPPPRLRWEEWHVPLARPLALDQATMIMVGI